MPDVIAMHQWFTCGSAGRWTVRNKTHQVCGTFSPHNAAELADRLNRGEKCTLSIISLDRRRVVSLSTCVPTTQVKALADLISGVLL